MWVCGSRQRTGRTKGGRQLTERRTLLAFRCGQDEDDHHRKQESAKGRMKRQPHRSCTCSRLWCEAPLKNDLKVVPEKYLLRPRALCSPHGAPLLARPKGLCFTARRQGASPTHRSSSSPGASSHLCPSSPRTDAQKDPLPPTRTCAALFVSSPSSFLSCSKAFAERDHIKGKAASAPALFETLKHVALSFLRPTHAVLVVAELQPGGQNGEATARFSLRDSFMLRSDDFASSSRSTRT